jgi:hypothetical protein
MKLSFLGLAIETTVDASAFEERSIERAALRMIKKEERTAKINAAAARHAEEYKAKQIAIAATVERMKAERARDITPADETAEAKRARLMAELAAMDGAKA